MGIFREFFNLFRFFPPKVWGGRRRRREEKKKGGDEGWSIVNKYGFFASSSPGTFQQYVVSRANYVTPIPDGLSSADAAVGPRSVFGDYEVNADLVQAHVVRRSDDVCGSKALAGQIGSMGGDIWGWWRTRYPFLPPVPPFNFFALCLSFFFG